MVDAIYFPLPRGSFSLVPVFAPTENPFTEALCPVPSETTLPSAIRIKSEVSFETTRSFFPYEKCFIRLPSALTALTPKCRCNGIPSVYHGACNAYKSYRRELKGLSKGHRRQFNCSNIFLFMYNSRCLSRYINPRPIHQTKIRHLAEKRSDTPTRAPTSIKTGLHEFIIPSKKVSLPCPPFL